MPCADDRFLPRLRRSAEYRAIRQRIVDRNPADTWLEDGLHFFVFTVAPDVQLDYTPFDPPQAVFVYDGATRALASAVVVEMPTPGEEPPVIDLRASERPWRNRLGDVRSRVAAALPRPVAVKSLR